MTAFATVAELGSFVGYDLVGDQLVTGTQLLELAAADIRAWTHRRYDLVANDTIALAGTWTRKLVLPDWPVAAVTNVAINGQTLTTQDYSLQGDRGVMWRPRTWGTSGIGFAPVIPPFWNGTPPFWGGPDYTVALTYTHGFATPPDRVKLASLVHAAYRLTNPTGELARLRTDDIEEFFLIGPERGFTPTTWRQYVRDDRRVALQRVMDKR